MIFLKTKDEIELIRESCLTVSRTLAHVARFLQPGVTTKELDRIAEEFIQNCGGKPAFKGYQGFPATLCISVNDTVVHGIPGDYRIKDGDLVSVDCGVELNGFFGDSCYTFLVGNATAGKQKLCTVTRRCLELGIEQALEGKRLGCIGHAVQKHAELAGFSVVREMVGHGIGRQLHEDPQVPNYGRTWQGIKLQAGMVLAIEPMINAGSRKIFQSDDGWTVKTIDGKPSAHYEHTVVVGYDTAEVLSDFNLIENEIKKNSNLWQNSLQ